MKINETKSFEKFNAWLNARIRTSKKACDQVVAEQFKFVIATAMKLTPPMNDTTFPRGLSANKGKIKQGTRQAFRLVDQSKRKTGAEKLNAQSVQSIIGWYNSKLNKRKQFVGTQKLEIWKHQLPQIREVLFARIGITAAGWCAAADPLRVKYPEWISRHKGKNRGMFEFRTNGAKLIIRAKNPTRHPETEFLNSRLNRAYSRQARKMEATIIKAIESGKITETQAFGGG